MNSLILFIFLIKLCMCAVEFSERPRNFSIELLYFTQKEMNGHVVISPFGIWSLMTSVSAGAADNSKYQLRTVLRLPENQISVINGYQNLDKTVIDQEADDVDLISNNFMFIDIDVTVKPSFKQTQAFGFKTDLQYLKFQDSASAAQSANYLIQGSSVGATNVFTSDDFAQSRLILTNVIKFKGFWTSPFNTSDTNVEAFYDEKKRKIGEVNMMYQRSPLPYSNIQLLRSLAVELSYGSDQKYSMLVILPYPKVKVTDVYRKLEAISLVDVFTRLQKDIDEFGLEDVDIKLPRFKISTNVVLNRPLNNMGVIDIFNEKLANFKYITDDSIYVSTIVHKADIEVTESGTEASGATYAEFSDRMSTPRFEANRPFIYFIMEKTTATVIFAGIYSQPSKF